MSKKISHLADIHIPNDISKHPNIRKILERTIEDLKLKLPSHIVIVGDLFHDFLKPNNEAKSLAGYFLDSLSKIAPVVITLGNHDMLAKLGSSRLDSVQILVDLMNNPNVTYYNTTGFYEDKTDSDIIWCVWHHPDKQSPWVKETIEKEPTKTYIDLFHDPINTSKTSTGNEFNETHYVSLENFLGDVGMFGDIHLYQTFNKNNKLFAAYSSSLFQNNYGEDPINHGYILWDINDKETLTLEYNRIQNDEVYLNYKLKGNNDIDYDNISIELETKPTTYVKIHWIDSPAMVNKDNERKIRKYIKDTYPEVQVIKFDKSKVNKELIKETEELKRQIKNIDNINVQHEIFKTYLKDKGYDDTFISEIIELDLKITSRLTTTNRNSQYEWELLEFYLENYRSHGDRTTINWENKNGIWQVTGKNGKGKTNLLSSVCYLLYNKTLETLKREANGDNRFINKMRDLNYCEVSAIFRINGIKYRITRNSERKWDRSKTSITGVATKINIDLLDEDNTVVLQETDDKNVTQKLIQDCFGEFEDFLRTSLINADTLNSLLSMDEAVFMDSILRDSGLDIYEKKIIEHKDFKKENYKKEPKVVINIDDTQKEIITIGESIKEKEIECVSIDEKIKELESRIDKGNIIREETFKKIKQVDPKLELLNINTLKATINDLVYQKEKCERDIESLQSKIILLKENFDEVKFNNLLSSKDEVKNDILNLKQEIKGKEADKENNDRLIEQNNGQIFLTNKNIAGFNKQIEDEKTLISSKITLKEKEIVNVKNQINWNVKSIQDEISKLEHSKICPTCNRDLEQKDIDFIQLDIKEKQLSITKLGATLLTNDEIISLTNDIKVFNDELLNGNNKISGYLLDITNSNIKITEIITNNELIKLEIVNILNTIKELGEKMNQLQTKLSVIDEDVVLIELDKKEVEERKELLNQKSNVPLLIENIDLKITNNTKQIEDFIINENVIKENEKVYQTIEKYKEAIDKLNKERDLENNNLHNVKNVIIVNFNNRINDINDKIAKFKEQERDELVNKVYLDCIHRDGIPKLLLLKMRDDINQELDNLLSDMEFNVFFDDNMVLKMYKNNKPDSIQNVIGGSGMERTFISVVLRLVLRNINNKSIGNVLFMDEICGKLVDESVIYFFELIHKMKKSIDKIVIIEHAYSDELNPDHVILVDADENFVSSINVLY